MLLLAEAKDKLIGMKHSMSKPDEIYAIYPKTGAETELSFLNKPILGQLTLSKVEERWIKTTDNKQMLTWVIYPPHFVSEQKVSNDFVLRRWTAINGQPILVVSLEFSTDGSQRIYRCSSKSTRIAWIRYGMAGANQWRLWWPKHERLPFGNRCSS